jgi:transposase
VVGDADSCRSSSAGGPGVVDEALRELSRTFNRLYAREGRPSIPPERLLRALLLQAFYTVRSERQLMEQLDYNLLFRWLVGLSADDPVWDATVFCKNRDRLLEGDIARKFMASVLNLPQVRRLLSSEHFSVDGTLIEAWASMKSFVPKDRHPPGSGKGPRTGGGRNAERDFHGEKRNNDTHSSTTDPDARLFRKGASKEAKLCHTGHLMMENHNGLIVDARLTEANGTAERTTALDMIEDTASPAARWAATRTIIRLTLSPAVVSAAARRTSRRTTPTAARRSMRARPVMLAITSALSSASE